MPAGRPPENRKRLVAYVQKQTHKSITSQVDKRKRGVSTVGKVLDNAFTKPLSTENQP